MVENILHRKMIEFILCPSIQAIKGVVIKLKFPSYLAPSKSMYWFQNRKKYKWNLKFIDMHVV